MREGQSRKATFGSRRRGRWLGAIGLLIVFVAGSSGRGDATDPATVLDQKLLAAATKDSEILANLTYLCDEIGPRLTGTRNLKQANAWAAETMKS